VDVLEFVRRIDRELSVVLCAIRHVEASAVLSFIEVVAWSHPSKPRNVPHQHPEHVIERAILEHHDDDVPDARVSQGFGSRTRAGRRDSTAGHQRQPRPSSKQRHAMTSREFRRARGDDAAP
jgi:hypothetical protein